MGLGEFLKGCHRLPLVDCNLPAREREGFLEFFEDEKPFVELHPLGAEETAINFSLTAIGHEVEFFTGD